VTAFSRLAELAAAKLKPGHLCIVYTGKIYLPQVLEAMCQHLVYWWVFAVQLQWPQRMLSRRVQNRWRLLLAFSKGKQRQPPDMVSDLLIAGGGWDTDLHPCQQSQSEAEYLISRLTQPGDLVCDSYCGSGTIPAAAKKMGRRWLGCELDRNHAATARRRVAECSSGG
jgi:site-specific DNA-methyltransferase (adenine-specific)